VYKTNTTAKTQKIYAQKLCKLKKAQLKQTIKKLENTTGKPKLTFMDVMLDWSCRVIQYSRPCLSK